MRVRMYRHGLGDCLLVTLRPHNEADFHLMIDCGVIQNADKKSKGLLGQAIDDIIKVTNGFVDVLVVTHEHWDHVSGFSQFKDKFVPRGTSDAARKGKLMVGEVWLAWTENPRDALARKIRDDRKLGISAVFQASKLLQSSGDASAQGLDALMGFFGMGNQDGKLFGVSRTGSAMDVAKALGRGRGRTRYCKPGDPPWVSGRVPGFRIFTLGPPKSENMLRKLQSSKELYKLDEGSIQGLETGLQFSGQDRAEDEPNQPFDPTHRIPLTALRAIAEDDEAEASDRISDFFRRHYFGPDPVAIDYDQSWRRIDHSWILGARDLALRLDNQTNNTSLVLAIEIEDSGKVLLFAADAQVGNWLSWQDTRWSVGGQTVTGPDLLARTVFYKVGHHGSHNATLKRNGLEQMTSGDLVAFIPVNEKQAKKNRWHAMPMPKLVKVLDQQTGNRVVRSDRDHKRQAWLNETSLYQEFRLQD